MTRRNSVHYGERFKVSAYTPSRKLSDAAAERTEGLVEYFLSCAHRDQMKWRDDLFTLARSCYLQGATDMADVAAQIQLKEEKDME